MSLVTHALTPEDLTAQKDRLYASILLNEGVVDVAGGSFEVNEDTGSNLNVRVGSGTVGDKAVVSGDSTADQGNYVVLSQDATDIVTLSAGDGSNPRIDRVGILVQDDEADSSGQFAAILTVVEGTPSSSPSAPAEPDNFLTLALVEVGTAASAITNANITDARVSARSGGAAPGGVLGYAERTTTQGSIGNTEADLTGLSVTVDVGTSRRIRITGAANLVWGTEASLIEGRFRESTTQLGMWARERSGKGVDTQTIWAEGSVVLTPSAGSHTYRLTLRCTSVGTVEMQASSTQRAFILVEDIGPA